MFNFFKRKKSLRKLSDEEALDLEACLAQNGLPFDSQEAAEQYFFPIRDNDLQKIAELNQKYPELHLDFRAKSLARLEAFYFKNFVDTKTDIGISKEEMENLITQYMRQVFVNLEMAEWIVAENDFAEGRYELALLYGYGPWTTEHYAQGLDKTGNKDHTYLYEKFMMYVPKEREEEVQ